MRGTHRIGSLAVVVVVYAVYAVYALTVELDMCRVRWCLARIFGKMV